LTFRKKENKKKPQVSERNLPKNAVESELKDLKKKENETLVTFRKKKQKKPKFLYETYPSQECRRIEAEGPKKREETKR